MSTPGDERPVGESAGEAEPVVEVAIRSPRDDGYHLVGDPEALSETSADRLAQAVTDVGVAVTEARKTTGYTDAGLPTGGNSLWWPDRTAQVVQATFVTPAQVGAFLHARIGQPHARLRIITVDRWATGQFMATAQLRIRRAGWRRVTLTVYATPSRNLTVVEMMPRRAWMPQTKRYLASGVPAITELTDEVENAADDHR